MIGVVKQKQVFSLQMQIFPGSFESDFSGTNIFRMHLKFETGRYSAGGACETAHSPHAGGHGNQPRYLRFAEEIGGKK
jgi:hypothetical protein